MIAVPLRGLVPLLLATLGGAAPRPAAANEQGSGSDCPPAHPLAAAHVRQLLSAPHVGVLRERFHLTDVPPDSVVQLMTQTDAETCRALRHRLEPIDRSHVRKASYFRAGRHYFVYAEPAQRRARVTRVAPDRVGIAPADVPDARLYVLDDKLAVQGILGS